jgi:hypothetical protein|tara:strand:- start:1981 stop:2649 length:669 start_codon:yes stop_codon:yes gene_type:complete
MICSSCGANSDNEDKCDYCGSKITRIDTSEILIEKDSRKAGILELNDQLSYIYSDKNNTDQVVSRLIDSSKEFIDSGDLKRAEFLLQLASGHDNNNDEVVLLAAKVKVCFALNLSGSVQMANIKKKYVLDAKKLLARLNSDHFSEEKKELELLISTVDGKEASHFTVQGNVSPNTSIEELRERDAAAKSSESAAESAAGCGTVIAVIFGILIFLGMLVPYLE